MEFNHKFQIVTLFLLSLTSPATALHIVRGNVTCYPKKLNLGGNIFTILIVLTLAYQFSLASHNDNTPAPLKVVVQFP